MRSWLAVLVLFAGCERIFKIDEVGPLPGADGSAAGSACTTVQPHDDFRASAICTTWGQADNSSHLMTGSGELVIDIDSTGGNAGCETVGYGPLPATGIFVEVTQFLDTQSGYTVFHANATAGNVSAAIAASSSAVGLFDGATTPFSLLYADSVATWWRLRPVPTGIEGSISTDGIHWMPIGIVPGVVGDVKILLQAGVNTPGLPATGRAKYAHFDLCP